MTQEFFARLVEKNYLGHLHHQQGRFRSFLLTFLKHFLADERDKAAAQKRGGGQTPISLDELSPETRYALEPAVATSAEQIFDRRWAETVLAQALANLGAEYAAQGKTELFDRLKDLQAGEHGTQTYAQVGEQLGMTETAIKSAVHRLRQRYRELLRAEIAHTVATQAEIDEEIRYLISVMSQ